MIIRVKDLWQRRTAIEWFLSIKLPIEQADRISEIGDLIWTAYVTYKIERERKAAEMKLTGGKQKNDKTWEKRQAAYNKWASEAADEEVNVNVPPVPLNALEGIQISATNLIHLREIGLIEQRNA